MDAIDKLIDGDISLGEYLNGDVVENDNSVVFSTTELFSGNFDLDYVIDNYLLENNALAFAKKHVKISTNHDPGAQFKDPHEVIDHLSKADPTPNKGYTTQIARWYSSGGFKQEDVGLEEPCSGCRGTGKERVGETARMRDHFDCRGSGIKKTGVNATIDYFHRNKGDVERAKKEGRPHLPFATIDKYKTYDELFNAVTQHQMDRGAKWTSAEAYSPEEHAEIDKHSKVIHDDDDLQVRMILGKPGALLLGKGTNWCTASVTGGYYNSYIPNGPVYCIVDKKRKFTPRNDPRGKLDGRYQFHFQGDQYEPEDFNKVSSSHAKGEGFAGTGTTPPTITNRGHSGTELSSVGNIGQDHHSFVNTFPVLKKIFHGKHYDWSDEKTLLDDIKAQLMAELGQ